VRLAPHTAIGYQCDVSPARLAHLLSAAILTGNELGTLTVVHPAIARLPLRERVRGEQALTRRYGSVMPWVVTITVASGLAAARDRLNRGVALGGAGCFATTLGVTLAGNVPLNVRVMGFDERGDADEWRALRRRWDRLHMALAALGGAGLVCAILAVASSTGPHR
jgi:hypothetical protein